MSMKQSAKLRPGPLDGLVALLVALLAVACGFAIWGQGGEEEELTIVVSVDGQEVERCPLERFPDTEQVYSGNGYTLRVRTGKEADGELGVLVAVSDCPTQDCVHTGRITRPGQSIVCLPARIIIQLEGGTKSDAVPDLVIG